MKWLYAAFDVGVLAGPLIASGIWLRDFWHHSRALFISLAAVGVPWVVMDVLAHQLGWWQYNPQYIFGVRLFGLPLEEIAFFIVVPFACLVVWHACTRLKGSVPAWLPMAVLGVVLAVCAGLILFFLGHMRTVVDAGIAIITIAALWDNALLRRRAWWYWNGIVLVLFLVCNSILTGAPIVIYDATAATGWYIGTIPIEDVLYNFSLLNLLVLTYVNCKK
jgi:lycopene cyclase domain-containing protein